MRPSLQAQAGWSWCCWTIVSRHPGYVRLSLTILVLLGLGSLGASSEESESELLSWATEVTRGGNGHCRDGVRENGCPASRKIQTFPPTGYPSDFIVILSRTLQQNRFEERSEKHREKSREMCKYPTMLWGTRGKNTSQSIELRADNLYGNCSCKLGWEIMTDSMPHLKCHSRMGIWTQVTKVAVQQSTHYTSLAL